VVNKQCEITAVIEREPNMINGRVRAIREVRRVPSKEKENSDAGFRRRWNQDSLMEI
jgi:hypothetical protein